MDGLDAVNPLSYLMLQATIDHTDGANRPFPWRLSRKNPEDFFLKIAELIQTGSGFPAIYSDDIGMKQLMKKGIPPELARDWVGLGCVEATCRARCPNGVRRGITTSPPPSNSRSPTASISRAAKSSALKPAIRHPSRPLNSSATRARPARSPAPHLLQYAEPAGTPAPALPAQPRGLNGLLDCVEKGKDLMRGGARYNTGPGMNGNGVADYADSMVAVKKLVFDEKKVDMATLADA
mgnify:CR=1 FL=1